MFPNPPPHSAAACSAHLTGSDISLQALSSVTATLELLDLVVPYIDFGLPYTLAHCTRLQTLHVDAESIRNFKPEVLPLTLREIRSGFTEGHAMTTLDETLVPNFPVGGTVDRDQGDERLLDGGH